VPAGTGLVAWCREKDSNLRRRLPADLQSASFDHSDIPARTRPDAIAHGRERRNTRYEAWSMKYRSLRSLEH
jgi:hypothetical protein